MDSRRLASALWLALTLPSALFACSHPAERILAGRWQGASVENFDERQVAAATGWARGTELAFSGSRLTVSVPAEEPRSGTYRLTAIEDQKVTLAVLGADGEEAEMELIVDDEQNLRWMLGEGRTVLMKRR